MASKAEFLGRSGTVSHQIAWRSDVAKRVTTLNPLLGWNNRDPRCETFAAEWIKAPSSAVAPRPASHQAGWSAASLFSGCGGLDLGFALEGVESTQAYDSSAAAVRAFNLNHRPAARVLDLSIQLPTLEGCSVLLAGAPCQGFSTNGRRQANDRRNKLLESVDATAARFRPKVVVVENVPAALSGAHAAHWLGLEARLTALGYNVRRLHLQAQNHGAAQNRKRLFLIAWIGSDCLRISLPSQPRLTLGQALSHLSSTDDHSPRLLEPDTPAYHIARRMAPGQKLSNVRISPRNLATWDIPEVFGATTPFERRILIGVTRLRRRNRQRSFGDGDPVAISALTNEVGFDVSDAVESLIIRNYLREVDGRVEHRHTYNGKYRRLDWMALSPTVDTHFANPSLFLHPQQNRGMTLREGMRIQGFPDWFRLSGSHGAMWDQIGNAVPPSMARDLALFIREAILKA